MVTISVKISYKMYSCETKYSCLPLIDTIGLNNNCNGQKRAIREKTND